MPALKELEEWSKEHPWKNPIPAAKNYLSEATTISNEDLFKSQYDGIPFIENQRDSINTEFLLEHPNHTIEVNPETGERFAVDDKGDKYLIDPSNSINKDGTDDEDNSNDDSSSSGSSSDDSTTEEDSSKEPVEDTSLGKPETKKVEEEKKSDYPDYMNCPVIGNILLYNYFCKNPYFLNGTITVMGREQYHIGERVKTQDGIEWYVEGVNHSITCYTGNWVTTLAVTRGIPPKFRFSEPYGEWDSLTQMHIVDWLRINDAIISDNSTQTADGSDSTQNYNTIDMSQLDSFIEKLNSRGGMFHESVGCVEAVVRMGTKLGMPTLVKASHGSDIENVDEWGGMAECDSFVAFCRENGINLLTDYDNNKQYIVAGDVVLFPYSGGGYGHVVLADGKGGCYGNSSSSYSNGRGQVKHYSDCGESWGSSYPCAILQTGREMASSGTGSQATPVSYINNEEACVKVLKAAGFSLPQVIALCANIQAESGFNSLSIRDGSTTWGLLHWHGKRKELLMLHTSGKDVYSIEHQLEFMLNKEFEEYKQSSKEIINRITEDESGLSASEGASLFFVDFVTPHPDDKLEDETLKSTDIQQRARAIGQIAIDIAEEVKEYYDKSATKKTTTSNSNSAPVADSDNHGTSSSSSSSSSTNSYNNAMNNASTSTNQSSSNSQNTDIYVGNTNLNNYIND